MKPILLFLFFVCLYHSSVEQSVIEVKYEADAKGNYQFTCKNYGYCNYILEVAVMDLQNLRTDVKLPYAGVVEPGSTTLFKLTKENESSPSNFRYTVRYFKGCLKPKVNMDFTYLLPVAPGKETKTVEMDYFLKKYSNEPNPKDWYALSIKMNPGDTVFASRRGRVNEVKDNANLKEVGYAMASNDNFIEIYHNDCSFARYQVFKDKSIFVKAGDFVEAGEPLGIVGGEKYASGAHVRFLVYYIIAKNEFPEAEKPNGTMALGYVPMQFWTKDNGKIKLVNNSNYSSEHPMTLITGEMNKRELKKWTDKQKK